MLSFGITADDVGVVMDDAVPEEGRRIAIAGLAGHFVQPRQADQLRDLGVGVLALQFIAALRKGRQDSLVIDALRQVEEALFPGTGIGLGQGFVEAAMFRRQNLLHLRVVERSQHADQVVGHPDRDVQSLGVVAVAVGVEQAGMDLVPGIDGHPATIEVEAVGSELFGADLLIDDLTVDHLAAALDRRAADIPIAMLGLYGGHFGNRVIDARLEVRIARLAIGQRTGGQVMTERMSGNAHTLPAAIDLALGGEARADIEIVQQALRAKRL